MSKHNHKNFNTTANTNNTTNKNQEATTMTNTTANTAPITHENPETVKACRAMLTAISENNWKSPTAKQWEEAGLKDHNFIRLIEKAHRLLLKAHSNTNETISDEALDNAIEALRKIYPDLEISRTTKVFEEALRNQIAIKTKADKTSGKLGFAYASKNTFVKNVCKMLFLAMNGEMALTIDDKLLKAMKDPSETAKKATKTDLEKQNADLLKQIDEQNARMARMEAMLEKLGLAA